MTAGQQAFASGPASLRIDKLLWYLRLSPSRTRAQALAEAGHVRLNGRRIERAHVAVRVGDIVVLPWGEASRIVRIIALPRRRGPPIEAQSQYEELTAGS